MATQLFDYFVSCPPGFEPMVADELRRLKLRSVRPQRSGVIFRGDAAAGMRAVFWSRLGTRVLLTLGQVDAKTANELYEGVREFAWEDHLRDSGTLAVDVTGTNEALRNTQFTAVRTKDAIVDRFRDRFGRRPSVDGTNPDLRVNVAVRAKTATISVDLSGAPLHRRGYREQGVQVAAPMKETLAAAVLELAGWREIAEKGGSFVDPMCGSGTLAIEAAMVAADIAPGLLRADHSLTRWLGFDDAAWTHIREDAERRRTRGMERLGYIYGSDNDKQAVRIARRFADRAGLAGYVSIEHAELADLTLSEPVEPGLVATNPPWGERLSERSELPPLYVALAERLREHFAGWRLAVVSPDPELARHLQLKPTLVTTLGTAKAAATISIFDLVPPAPKTGRPTRPVTIDSGADIFANRLQKMARHYGKWAKRTGTTCYRVYDSDLPDYAVAVDLYEGAGPDEGKRWAHVAEYAAPGHIDPMRAAARIDAVSAVVPEILEIDPDDVFIKRRERQRGSSQYEKVSRAGVVARVAENGLLFEVNFSDFLDTGIFLDHRDTRAWIKELSPQKNFLNLFAYTGSATVYAAAGEASSTTTVDLSTTYLGWAKRNLALNGLEGENHRFERYDVLDWLDIASHSSTRFDLVFCDPPTFSNSKRMEGTWDVQRDHAALIQGIERVLADDGTLIFSCNRKSFSLDTDALAQSGFTATDVTARTIPKDFERTPGVHKCWKIERT